ncbi:hypothetical protein [Streptomyces acidicola]|uniref:hypothetical protein n=1 Tax=Streptomyces acidicola TaxID=2596892 RepID=UPI0037F95DEE
MADLAFMDGGRAAGVLAKTDGRILAEGEGNPGFAVATIVLIFLVAACLLVAAFLSDENTPKLLGAAALFGFIGFIGLYNYLSVAWSESELQAAVKEATEAVAGSDNYLTLDDELGRAAKGRGSTLWLHVESKEGSEIEISAEGTSARFCISETRYTAEWYKGGEE